MKLYIPISFCIYNDVPQKLPQRDESGRFIHCCCYGKFLSRVGALWLSFLSLWDNLKLHRVCYLNLLSHAAFNMVGSGISSQLVYCMSDNAWSNLAQRADCVAEQACNKNRSFEILCSWLTGERMRGSDRSSQQFVRVSLDIRILW